MKKIPKAILIVMDKTDDSFIFRINGCLHIRKFIVTETFILIPPKEFNDTSERLRLMKQYLEAVGHIINFRIIPVDTWERYCKFIADNFSKEDMVYREFFKKLSKGKYKRKYLMYLMECIDFLLEKGVKGPPWTQKEI